MLITLQAKPTNGLIPGTNPYSGLGDPGDNTAAAGTAIQITGAGVAGVQSAITAGLISNAWVAAAVPVVGAVVAGVALALTLIATLRKKPGQKIATTQIVNEVEPQLEKNRDGYFSGPRTVASKIVALANFDAGFREVVLACGVEEYGEPGSWCIEDRMPAGYQYTLDGKSWIGNGKWDWFSYYRDPIANDTPNPNPSDPGSGGQYIVGTDPLTGRPLYTASTTSKSTWIIGGLIAVAALVATMGEGKK